MASSGMLRKIRDRRYSKAVLPRAKLRKISITRAANTGRTPSVQTCAARSGSPVKYSANPTTNPVNEIANSAMSSRSCRICLIAIRILLVICLSSYWRYLWISDCHACFILCINQSHFFYESRWFTARIFEWCEQKNKNARKSNSYYWYHHINYCRICFPRRTC